MYLDTIKPGGDGIGCGMAVVLHQPRQLVQTQGAWCRGFHKARHAIFDEHGFGFGGDGRWRYRCTATRLQIHMRDAAHVPQLHDDLAARGVNRVGHHFPQGHLFIAPDAGHIRVALALVADGGGLGHDEPGAVHRVSALRVVSGHQLRRPGAGRAIAGEGCHHDAVGKVHGTDLKRAEQIGHEKCGGFT